MTSSASHTLTFSRLRASFTVDKELIGKQDPYVIFTSGNAKAQTKAIKGVGTGTAEWKETYSLDKFSPSSSSIVEVTVYNHNTLLPDNVIGSGTVDLSNQGESSLSGSGEPVSVILTDKKAQEVGTISFIVNGGGYRGRSGTSSGTGYGSSTATGAGTGYGSNTGTGSQTGYGSNTGTGTGSQTGYGSGSQTGYGSGSQTGYGSNSGNVVGTGVGTDKSVAQKASDAAAAQGKQVTIEEGNSLGVGHPKTTSGSNTGYTGSRSENTGSTTGYGATGTDTTRSGIATGAVAGDKTVYGEREGDVIDRKYYVGTESRPQDQALVEQYREHNPYAKDYETTVQHTGRERLVNSQIEALGTRERLIGQDHHIHAHPHTEIARNLPASGAVIPGIEEHAGAMAERPGGEGWVQTKVGPICDTNTFSITGDRTVDKERVTDLREHREFEKEFEVKTRLVGERALARGTEAEILNRERVLVDEKNKIACEGHPVASAAGGNTIASQQGGSYSATGATGVGAGTTGSGYSSGSTTGGTGYNSGSTTGAGYSNTGTGSGYNTSSGRGTTGQTTGEKAASYIPGSEENQSKKGNTQGTTGRPTIGEKAASFIPGSEENREKKAERQYA